ncbi:MAG: hypothetical protein J3K34DRAFT_473642 [Monoraphidium minutum]|nr:MAG: hypothetical protein J3K34DRAFT_473642 [Monoraphidium minutum]
MSGGYFKAQVKEVLSGDSLVLVGGSRPGVVPAEKRLTLSSLIAPKLGKRDGSNKDEPFAWAAREFLRKKLIGQMITFKIDYVVEAIGNKEFGSVFLQTPEGKQENVSLSIVQNGWAKVRETGSQQSPIIEDLRKAQDAAQQGGVGLWTKDSQALASAVRPAAHADGFNAVDFLQKVGKSKPVAGIVEAVLNGSTLRVMLLPDLTPVTVHVSGVQCPSMSKRPPGAGAAVAAAESGTPAVPAAAGGDGAAAATAAPTVPVAAGAGASQGQPEPFAREAKWFTEQRALNREVRVVLDGVDKYSNLFGGVMYPDGDKPANLAEGLMQAGLAKCVEWSLQMMTVGAMRLREMERAVKASKRGIWHSYVPVATGQTKLSDSFVGRVNEVSSGDTMIIKDVNAGIERRVQLSSIRSPRVGIRDRAPEPHGNEAREFLRKKFIGKEVNVKMEYTRKVQAMPGVEGGAPAGEERVLSFGNVELLGAKDGEDKNASEMAVARGYATVIRHRTDEERSGVYEKLMALEEAAKAAKRGEVAAPRLNDVSTPGNAARAKQYLPFFQRSGRVAAQVEYVLSGHRLKIHVAKEGVSIAFAPSGIKTPARAQAASHGRPAVAGEPFADEAFAFTRDNFMQRDVEIEVESVDKGGTFLGTVTLLGAKPTNLGLALLKQGLAKLQPFFSVERVRGGAELAAAQQSAKEARLKIWEHWSPEDDKVEGDDDDAAAEGAGGGAGEVLTVTVTEVANGNEFFLQVVEEPRVRWVEEQLKGLSLGDAATPAISQGSLALARFTLDDNWYRAYVEKVHPAEPKYEVFFLDYGNRERLPSDRMRPCDAALAAVPPQAKAAQLAYLRIPGLDEEFGQDAASTLAALVGGGKRLRASVIGCERGARERHPAKAAGKLIVVLKEEGAERSINAEMLAAGMGRLPALRKLREPAAREAVNKLQEFQEEARRGHRGIFEYGDPGDSDDEADAPRKPTGGRGGGRGGRGGR